MKKSVLFLFSLLLVTFSCQIRKEEEPVITIDPILSVDQTDVTATDEGGSQTITFDSNVSWTAESSESWCEVYPANGNASTKNTLVTPSPNNTHAERSCIITIKAGSLSKTITIHQGSKSGLLVTKSKYDLSNDATTIEVEVKANVEFDLDISEDWITIPTTRGLVSTQLNFDIAKNETYGNRNGTITIKQKDGELESIITVYQSQEDAIIISDKTVELFAEKQTINVYLKTNVDFAVIIPEAAKNWVSLEPETRALRFDKLIFKIAENKSGEARTTEIYVKDKKTELQDTLTIDQSGTLAFSISTDEFNVTADGTTVEFDVVTSLLYEVIITDNWITQGPTIGTKLSFNIAKNNAHEVRDASIIIKQKNGLFSKYIPIYQAESKEDALILSKKVEEVSGGSQTLEVELKANVDFDVTIPEAAKSWVSYTGTRSLRTEILLLDITENKNFAARTTKIYIKDKATSLQETLTINQHFKGNEVFVETMGTLCTILSKAQKDTITTMSVKGQINRADFEVFKSQMPKLKYLDLKNVKCENDEIPDRSIGAVGPNKTIAKIVFPESITSIKELAFRDCSGLSGVLDLPKGLTTIGQFAFRNCKSLTSLNLPDGLTTITKLSFSGCSSLTGSLNLPDGLITLEETAFQSCRGLTSVNFPDGVKTIGISTFDGCTGLRGSLNLPDSLTTIGVTAFNNCSGISRLTFGNKLHTISAEAFKNCSSISGTVVFPISLKLIYPNAFEGCTKINAFRFPHTEPIWYFPDMFPAGATIEVPTVAVAKYKDLAGWNDYNIVGY